MEGSKRRREERETELPARGFVGLLYALLGDCADYWKIKAGMTPLPKCLLCQ